MQIRIRATGQVMYGEEFNRTICSLPITPELLDQYGADPVFEGPQASGGTVYQYSQYAGVEQIDGKWYTKYVLGPIFTDRPATATEPAMTAAEQEAAYKAQKDAEQADAQRKARNDKLKDCDWTQLADSTADKAAWGTYRQALRDVPSQAGFPWTIDWPVAS